MQPKPVEIRVDTTCPECGHTGRVPRDLIGYQVRCSRCDAKFLAVGSEPAPVIIPDPVSVERRREPLQFPARLKGVATKILLRLEDDSRPLYWGFLVVFLVAWLWLDVFSNERFPATIVAIVCLLGICVCITNLTPRVRHLSHWRRRAIAVAAFVPLIYMWSWFDAYTEIIEGYTTTKYVNRYKFGDDPYYMRVISHDTENTISGVPLFDIAQISIPLTRDGVSHGEGEMIIYDPYESRRVFYWYGEMVSEGEWHLRNK